MIDSFQVDIPPKVMEKVANLSFWSLIGKKKLRESILEKHFILSFLQSKEKFSMKSNLKPDYGDKLKELLKARGLEEWHEGESKQRVITFMIIDDSGKGVVNYNQFWSLLKLADVYDRLADHEMDKVNL